VLPDATRRNYMTVERCASVVVESLYRRGETQRRVSLSLTFLERLELIA
jgi:hypothetical protein